MSRDSSPSSSSSSPVYKVGAVVVRGALGANASLKPSPLGGEGLDEGAARLAQDSSHPLTQPSPSRAAAHPTDSRPLGSSDTRILILRTKPKQPGEVAPFVLPRGSRQYWEWHGDGRRYEDARDAATALAHAEQLEPLTRTLAREIGEEAGVTAAELAAAQVAELGAMDFQSRSKGVYPVHWFVVRPDAAALAAMDARAQAGQLPSDAVETRWASVAEIKAMAEAGDFSPGYLPVIDAALGLRAPPE